MEVSKTSDVGPIPAVPAIILIEFNSMEKEKIVKKLERW